MAVLRQFVLFLLLLFFPSFVAYCGTVCLFVYISVSLCMFVSQSGCFAVAVLWQFVPVFFYLTLVFYLLFSSLCFGLSSLVCLYVSCFLSLYYGSLYFFLLLSFSPRFLSVGLMSIFYIFVCLSLSKFAILSLYHVNLSFFYIKTTFFLFAELLFLAKIFTELDKETASFFLHPK